MEHKENLYLVVKIVKKDFTDVTHESESERLGKLYPVIITGWFYIPVPENAV